MFDRSRNLAVASAILLAAGPAFAGQGQPAVVYGEESENFRTERVDFSDLDLGTQYGERQLNRRVAATVRNVCLTDFSGSALQAADFYRCSGSAWAGARPQIAQAIARARDIAMNGKSSIAAAAITIRIR